MEFKASKIWSGDCWIIMGGDSIRKQFNIPESLVPLHLPEFRRFGEYLKPIHDQRVIGVNLAAFLGDWVDVAYCGDTKPFNEYRTWFDKFGGLKVSSAGKYKDPKYKSILHMYKDPSAAITQDPTALSWLGKNSGASAINLAYHLGATRIFLLGLDMYDAPSGRIHWHAGYPDASKTPTTAEIKQGKTIPRIQTKAPYKRHQTAFPEIAKEAKRLGIEIINVNPDSGVLDFPRRSVAQVLDNTIIKKKTNMLCTCSDSQAIGSFFTKNGLEMYQCSCGILQQVVDKQLIKTYYQKEYHQKAYNHSFRQDVIASQERLEVYGQNDQMISGRWLDIGSGNGAFVQEANKFSEVDCYGVELSDTYANFDNIYSKELKNNNFPTDYFQSVFLHDVLEHLIDPVQDLKEVFRIVKQEGTAVIEIPDFYNRKGLKHWKEKEHIWFFSKDQMIGLLEQVGFTILDTYLPIDGKITIICQKPVQNRVKILVPPGIGDIHWVLVKLQAFIEQYKTGLPDVYICSFDKKKDRSLEYLRMFPFLNAAGYKYYNKKDIPWREAYLQQGTTIFNNIKGVDYFIAFNGRLRAPVTLAQINPELGLNWDLPMFESIEDKEYLSKFEKQNTPKYIVAYLVDHGMYSKHWLKYFGKEKILSILKKLANKFYCKIVFVGASWDEGTELGNYLLQELGDQAIDLYGQTTVGQVFELQRGALGTIGFPSGLSIMSAVFKKPTYLFWSDYFNEVFWKTTCPTDSESWYGYGDVKKVTESEVFKTFSGLITQTVVVCVLKSGGEYDEKYVHNLRAMVKRHSTVPYEFYCYADIELKDKTIKKIQLQNNLPGWWSKIELFRHLFDGKYVVYLDLDTLICDNIDKLLKPCESFAMLEGFKSKRPASGIMTWKGDYSFVLEELLKDPETLMYKKDGLKMDQRFIAKVLTARGIIPEPIQARVQVCSFKNDIKETKKINGFDIVCFHGVPRPHQSDHKLVKEHWRV